MIEVLVDLIYGSIGIGVFLLVFELLRLREGFASLKQRVQRLEAPEALNHACCEKCTERIELDDTGSFSCGCRTLDRFDAENDVPPDAWGLTEEDIRYARIKIGIEYPTDDSMLLDMDVTSPRALPLGRPLKAHKAVQARWAKGKGAKRKGEGG